MDSAHLHLLLNHFPIIGLFAMFIAFLVALWKQSNLLLTFSLAGLIACALLTIPLHETGEAAEEVAESAGMGEAFIEEHEEAAEWATPLMYATGAAALLGLLLTRGKRDLPVWMKAVLIILLLFTQTSMMRTGYLGGKIRRPELQNGTAASPTIELEHKEHEEH